MIVASVAGCSTSVKKAEVGKEDGAAELVDLFEGFGEDAVAPSADAPVDVTPVDDLLADDADLEAITGDVSVDVSIPEPRFISPVDVATWDIVRGGVAGGRITGVTQGNFIRPVAAAARGEYLYVVDRGREAVLRLDMVSRSLDVILDLRTAVTGEVADIYVNPDFSFYLTDTDASRVLFFNRSGELMHTFRNHFNLAKPVAVAVMPGGDIVVADGHYDHLVRFNGEGRLIATYGARGTDSGQFLNVTSMTNGPDGFYVGSRVGRHVQVIGEDNQYRYSFEEGKVIFPSAIVVDGKNRSYVADLMDNTVKVFDRGRLVATLGGSGSGPGKFMRVTDLWLDGRFLYVVDSLNNRIQIGHLTAD